MAFALQLQDSLRHRESQVQSEFHSGDALGLILQRYLLAVEAEADDYILTSILLVDGKQLRHGAAPSLPEAYCQAIDGLEYGPDEGSCGTAAHFGRPVYVTDIATDPFWAQYRHLALEHGLRACWSTPIFDDERNVIGTFAIYHLTPRGPTQDEIDAIQTITDSVARTILWSRSAEMLARERAVAPPIVPQ
jgi:GAF domain-containing protein